MTAILAFIFSPIGRWVAGALVVTGLVAGVYAKGRLDGRSSYKAKIERQINDAVQKGDAGRADALRKLDDGGVSDNWFRD